MHVVAAAESVGHQDDGRCWQCDGAGTVENLKKAYPLRPSDVDQFIAFLQASGGFEIW